MACNSPSINCVYGVAVHHNVEKTLCYMSTKVQLLNQNLNLIEAWERL